LNAFSHHLDFIIKIIFSFIFFLGFEIKL